jgi:hypothetical protein
MEIGDREMNSYTNEETEELFYSLGVSVNSLITWLTYRGITYQIDIAYLLRMFEYGSDAMGSSHPMLSKELNDLITMVPLEEIPLFINILPEIVAWILRIGK